MRKHAIYLILIAATFAFAVACKKGATTSADQQPSISSETLAKISALGFSNQNVRVVKEGYLVEDDIVLTDDVLNGVNDQKLLRIANTEQYRTTNLVTGLPRVIKVKVTNLGTAFISGADLA